MNEIEEVVTTWTLLEGIDLAPVQIHICRVVVARSIKGDRLVILIDVTTDNDRGAAAVIVKEMIVGTGIVAESGGNLVGKVTDGEAVGV